MTPEGKVKAEIKKVLDSCMVWYFCPAANGYGRVGIPDFICCVNGHFLAIEAKANSTKQLTAPQEREIARIHQHGGVAMVVNSVDMTMLKDAVARLKERTNEYA